MQPFEPEELPIKDLDWSRLVPLIGRANRAVANFEGLLYRLPSTEVLLSPMITQEAVLSSRIEGTQAGFQDVLKYEAGDDIPEESSRLDIQEIVNYRSALRRAEELLKPKPFCINTLLELHSVLLNSVRGFNKSRGQFRTNQNWIGHPNSKQHEASFVPPRPEVLVHYMDKWEAYYHAEEPDPLVQLAIVHAQFEILHPFLDGNGRLGRMLVPLFLFEKRILSHPCFYVSDYLESHRDTYYARLRALGQRGSWTEWTEFFLLAISVQGEANTEKARAILDLYERLKSQVIELTHSQYAIPLLDFVFQRPIFRSTQLAEQPNMPSKPAVNNMLTKLRDAGVLRSVREGRGQRAQILAQPDLINLCEGRSILD